MDVFSFQPPAAAGERYPTSVILQREGYFGDNEGRNRTTAEAMTTTSHTVGVTFHLAYPPDVSYFCIHGRGLGRGDSKGVPEVVSAEKDLVLLRAPLSSSEKDHVFDEYFMYQASRRKPTLSLIPAHPTKHIQSMCILPPDDVDGEFLIANLVSTYSIVEYELYAFSSRTGEWIYRRRLSLTTSPDTNYADVPGPRTSKAIALGGGEVGWVDLWRGIKVCNVLDKDLKDPVLRLIPLPRAEQGPSSIWRRDVVVCDGFIQFLEIDCRFRHVLGINHEKKSFKKMTCDLENTDIIHDSEILIRNCHRVEPIPVPDGWKIRTCYRHPSWDYWRRGHIVDVDDLHDSTPEQLSDGSAGKWALKDLATEYPILSVVPSEDVVYLMAKVKSDDTKAWMIGLNLKNKTLQIRRPDSASYFRRPNFLACAFSGYLN